MQAPVNRRDITTHCIGGDQNEISRGCLYLSNRGWLGRRVLLRFKVRSVFGGLTSKEKR